MVHRRKVKTSMGIKFTKRCIFLKYFRAIQNTKSKPLPDRTKNYWLEVYLEKVNNKH